MRAKRLDNLMNYMAQDLDPTSVVCRRHAQEGSGKAGCRYEHVEGDLVFEKGVFEKTIDITILENALWSATLEFKVILEEPIRCHSSSRALEQFQVLLKWRWLTSLWHCLSLIP